MLAYLKKDCGFTLILVILLILSVLCSCERNEPLSIEDRINGIEQGEEMGTYLVTIGDKTFLFTSETYFVDSGWGFLSGEKNAEIDESLIGKYCLAGWGKNDKTRLVLLDVSWWQQPLFRTD